MNTSERITRNDDPFPKVWLTKKEAAEYMRISVRTIERLPIKRYKPGGTILFRIDEIDNFIKNNPR